MKKFIYEVIMKLEIDAFDEGDAWDAVQDTFSVGDNLGVKVVDCEYRDLGPKRN